MPSAGFTPHLQRNPAMLGSPSIDSGHWNPIMAACAETAQSWTWTSDPRVPRRPPPRTRRPDVQGVLFSPMRFPWRSTGLTRDCRAGSRIRKSVCPKAASGGSRSCWIARPYAQLSRDVRHLQAFGESFTPAEVFTRNFWVCAVEGKSLSCSATGSVWTTSCWKPTIRTATPPGHTRDKRSTKKSLNRPTDAIRNRAGRSLPLNRHPAPVEVQKNPRGPP